MTNKWDSKDIPNQKGKIVIVTGANSGIGYETARVLAEKNAIVILACRSEQRGRTALEKINLDNTEFMKLDLASLASVKKFSEEFRKKYSRLDLLINNAGVMAPPYSKTMDGFELQFGTNHLGHFALTGYLLDLLKKDARVVNVSSMAHKFGKIDFSDLNWEKRKYSGRVAYSASKIANLYFTFELDKLLKEHKYSAISVAAHPGWTHTNLQKYASVASILNPLFGQKPLMGALPTLRAAVEPGLIGGEYFGPSGFLEIKGYPVLVKPNKLSQDKNIAKKLWYVSEKLTGVRFKFK